MIHNFRDNDMPGLVKQWISKDVPSHFQSIIWVYQDHHWAWTSFTYPAPTKRDLIWVHRWWSSGSGSRSGWCTSGLTESTRMRSYNKWSVRDNPLCVTDVHFSLCRVRVPFQRLSPMIHSLLITVKSSRRRLLAKVVSQEDYNKLCQYHCLTMQEELDEFVHFCENHPHEQVRSELTCLLFII